MKSSLILLAEYRISCFVFFCSFSLPSHKIIKSSLILFILLPNLALISVNQFLFRLPQDFLRMYRMHRDLVRGFLQNASSMLDFDGEIHVTHKTTTPFDSWKIEDLGWECSLVCFAQDEFRIQDYPGYENKRGASSRADDPFPLGPCKTYRFRLAENNLIMRNKHLLPQMFPAPVGLQQQPQMSPFASQVFPTPPPLMVQDQPSSMAICDDGAASRYRASDECCRRSGRYLNDTEETFGDTSRVVRRSAEELWLDYVLYICSVLPGTRSNSFVSILEEMRQMQFGHDSLGKFISQL